MNTTCKCGKPTRDDGYFCDDCGTELSKALGDVPWLDEELETTIGRQKGVDYSRVGGSATPTAPRKEPNDRPDLGVHVQPDSLNWGATEARSHLKALLVSWALFCEAEAVRNSSPYDGLPADNLPALSRWLMWRVDGLALNEIGSEAVDEITSAVAHCRRVIDRSPDKWYAGPCNAGEAVECGTDLYALASTGGVTCTTCGSVYDVAARRTWLLKAAEDRLADAVTLARSVSWLGAEPLNAARVRKWASRGRIIAKGHDNDKPLYRIGDAIDLLAKEAS